MKTKKLLIFFIFMALLVITGCQKDAMQLHLAEIDRTVDRELRDTTAHKMLDKIDMADLKTEADSAYYYLLKTQILYKLYMPITSDSMINVSINYYEKHIDTEKLARAYYYKGATIYELGRVRESIPYIKKAETLAEKLHDNLMSHKVYQLLTLINGEAQEYAKALESVKKQYEFAEAIGNKSYMASALIDMATTYNFLNFTDSARVCLAECQKYIGYLHLDDQAYYYTTLGEVYMDSEPEMAIVYFKKATKCNGLPKAYKYLADFYIKEGEREKAKELWERALNNAKSHQLKKDALTALIQLQEEEHDNESMAKTAKWIIALNDSAAQKKKEEQVLELQSQYDNQAAEEKKYRFVTLGLISLTVILGIIAIYFLSIRLKRHSENTESNDGNDRKEADNTVVCNTEAFTKEENPENSLTDTYHIGKVLYEHVMNNKPIVMWTPDDYQNYFAYYRSVEADFFRHLAHDYNNLPPRQKMFMTLYHTGKTDREVCNIMGIEPASIRSIKTRIKQRRFEGNKENGD